MRLSDLLKSGTRSRNRGIAGQPRGGKRAIADREIYFRSAWEANWARYLEWLRQQGQIRSWEFEPETFWFHAIKRGTVGYLPDFKVVNRDGSVHYEEVKGWKHQRGETALRRMKRYYPDVVVIVVDGERYRTVARQVRALIEGWE